MKKSILFLIFCTIFSVSSNATIGLPSLIGDNMVLQRNTTVALWGTATPGSKVTVKPSWADTVTSVTAGPDGKWQAGVATPDAGGPYEIVLNDGVDTVLHNILVGEVWFASGQSNMEMPVKGYGSQPVDGAADAIIGAQPSRKLRICNIRKKSSLTELDSSVGGWREHDPSSVAETSATAYFFADALQSALDIPVGIVVSSWGGSTIQTWLSREVIESGFPEFRTDHLDGTAEVKREHQDPCLLYNGQVAPLAPYTFKGFIWYQGEANRGRPEQYIRLQTAYSNMMREKFRVPDAPFYFVGIAPYPYGKPNDWVRGYFVEAQRKSLYSIPHSGMVETCDIGAENVIHPSRKKDVGRRLAMLALNRDYGLDAIPSDAPRYRSVEFRDGKALVLFDVDAMGLAPLGINVPGFEIAGADKIFHKADAYVTKGKFVEVSSPLVESPEAVRYCFRNWCVGGLYNNYGMPAFSFRTDDWDNVPTDADASGASEKAEEKQQGPVTTQVQGNPAATFKTSASVDISAYGWDYSIKFKAAGPWKASVKEKGIAMLSPKSGKSGDGSVVLHFMPNESKSRRSVTLVISSKGYDDATLVVTQERAADYEMVFRTYPDEFSREMTFRTWPTLFKEQLRNDEPGTYTLTALNRAVCPNNVQVGFRPRGEGQFYLCYAHNGLLVGIAGNGKGGNIDLPAIPGRKLVKVEVFLCPVSQGQCVTTAVVNSAGSELLGGETFIPEINSIGLAKAAPSSIKEELTKDPGCYHCFKLRSTAANTPYSIQFGSRATVRWITLYYE
ncbi:MAG: hypothetical protein MJY62_00690 [Bacteroidales bacterium]|nr:hypothetical protein [Bacteroidales bacterium]